MPVPCRHFIVQFFTAFDSAHLRMLPAFASDTRSSFMYVIDSNNAQAAAQVLIVNMQLVGRRQAGIPPLLPQAADSCRT
jgi:hypothetical protein